VNIEKSYGCIPLKKGADGYQVFLVKLSSGNHWGFPKGHMEKNETPIETAKRELFEETNLTVESILSFPQIIEKYVLLRNGVRTEKIVEYFVVEVAGEKKLLYPEILDGRWVSINEAKSLLTYDSSKMSLHTLIEYLL